MKTRLLAWWFLYSLISDHGVMLFHGPVGPFEHTAACNVTGPHESNLACPCHRIREELFKSAPKGANITATPCVPDRLEGRMPR